MTKRSNLLGSLIGSEKPSLTEKQKAADGLTRAAMLLEQALGLPNVPSVWKLAAGELIQGLRESAEILEIGESYGTAFVFTSMGGEHTLHGIDLEPVALWPRNLTDIPELIAQNLDGGFLPDTNVEGEARVSVLEGWSIVGFFDRTADRRAGSHSTFVMRGVYPEAEGIAKARELFSALWERYTFDVVLQD